MKKISWISYFLLSSFLSWQAYQGLEIFFLRPLSDYSAYHKSYYLVAALICIVLERPVLKKLVKGNNVKTFFGLAYPFQTNQLVSILFGIFISLYIVNERIGSFNAPNFFNSL